MEWTRKLLKRFFLRCRRQNRRFTVYRTFAYLNSIFWPKDRLFLLCTSRVCSDRQNYDERFGSERSRFYLFSAIEYEWMGGGPAYHHDWAPSTELSISRIVNFSDLNMGLCLKRIYHIFRY